MDFEPKYGDCDNTLLAKIAGSLASGGGGGGGGSGVASFNARTGAVSLTSGDVTTALGFTPANAAAVVLSFNTRTGAVTLTSGDVTTALGFTPANASDLSLYLLKAGGTMTGGLLFTDNAVDIGALAATRPRTGYFGTSVIAPLFTGALTGAASLNVLKAGDNMTGALTIATNKISLNVDGSAAFVGFIQTPFLLDLFPDASTNTAPVVAEFSHTLTAGTAAANFGTSVDFSMDSDTTVRQIGARFSTVWTVAANATRTSRAKILLMNSGTLTEVLRVDAVNGGVSVFQTTGATPAEGLLLSNLTPAANGAQQFSPTLRFTGRAWGTAGGTSQAVEFRMYVLPVQGLVPSYTLQIDTALNGAAFANRYIFSSAGQFTALGQIISTTGAIVASTLGFQAGLNGTRWVPQADGIWTAYNNGSNDFNRIQLGGTTSSFPSLQRSSALLVARLADDSADTAIRATAFNIGANPLNYALTAYAAGTVYTLTATNAKVDFGTTDPVLTINAVGTYRLSGSVKIQLNGATFAANQTVTVLLRRTNNTAGNLTNSGSTFTVPVTTTLTQTLAIVRMNDIHYTTANTDDVIEIWADVSALPSAGTISIDAASLTAVRIA